MKKQNVQGWMNYKNMFFWLSQNERNENPKNSRMSVNWEIWWFIVPKFDKI